MSLFTVHTKDTAPEKSRDFMEAAEKRLGFVPNVVGVMAEAPALIKGYMTLTGIFGETSLTPAQQQIVLLTSARENGCEYCVAAHSAGAKRAGADDATIAAIRDSQPVSDPKDAALHELTRAIVAKRGWLDESDMKAFLDAGFDKTQILEVIVGCAVKMLSNYSNHISDTPLDEQFEATRWQAKQAA